MTRILFIANAVVNFTKYSFDSFYEGFINALTRNGNDVHFLKANLFLDQNKNQQNFQVNINKAKLVKYIKDIEPELIFTFNNNITKEILDATDCPVVFWSSESYDFLVSKELIKKYESRYLFIHFDETIRNQFIKNLSVKPQKNIATFLATDIRTKKVKQDKNISFLGTLHGTNKDFQAIKNFISSQKNRAHISRMLDKIKSAPLKALDLSNLAPNITKTTLMDLLSRYQRTTTLDALSDLGLYICGDKKWLEIFDSFPYLTLSYHDGYVCTLDEVSNFYNSSKISINSPHLQSESFLSYRCPDILASNAILLNKGKINRQYDPKGLIPHFNSPLEARDLAIKILDNQNQRQEIISYCHELVENKLRFEHRMKELEELLKIKLFNSKKKGKYNFIEPDDFSSSAWKIVFSVSTAILGLLPSSTINSAYKLFYPIQQFIPEDIKRVCRNKK
jgi:hypothetical protein